MQIPRVLHSAPTTATLNFRKQPLGLKLFIDSSITLTAAQKLTPEERLGRIVRGLLCDIERPSYIDLYDDLIRRINGNVPEGRPEGVHVH